MREGIWMVGERRNTVKVKSLQVGVNREGGGGVIGLRNRC